MLQFDIRVTVRERNRDLQRVVLFDYDAELEARIKYWLQDQIEDLQYYPNTRTFEFTIATIEAVK